MDNEMIDQPDKISMPESSSATCDNCFWTASGPWSKNAGMDHFRLSGHSWTFHLGSDEPKKEIPKFEFKDVNIEVHYTLGAQQIIDEHVKPLKKALKNWQKDYNYTRLALSEADEAVRELERELESEKRIHDETRRARDFARSEAEDYAKILRRCRDLLTRWGRTGRSHSEMSELYTALGDFNKGGYNG